MTHTEFYFAIHNYITIVMLILLAVILVGIVGLTIICKIKEKFDDYMEKKIDEEDWG